MRADMAPRGVMVALPYHAGLVHPGQRRYFVPVARARITAAVADGR